MTTPATPVGPAVQWTARLVVGFGGAVMLHWFVASYNQIGATLVDLAFAVALMAFALACRRALLGGDRRAMPAVLFIAVAGLFFVAPVVGTMLLGGGTEPIGTGWDSVFFPVVALLSLGMVGLFPATWRALGAPRPPERPADPDAPDGPNS